MTNLPLPPPPSLSPLTPLPSPPQLPPPPPLVVTTDIFRRISVFLLLLFRSTKVGGLINHLTVFVGFISNI